MPPLPATLRNSISSPCILLATIFIGYAGLLNAAESGQTTAAPKSKLSVSQLFSDHAVIQRHKQIRIQGTAAPDSKVSVRFAGQSADVTADASGSWEAKLSPMEAGGPYELEISSGGESIVRTDILIGEVWICTGQSNMQWPLRNAENGAQEILESTHPAIRLIRIGGEPLPSPRENFSSSGWAICGPKSTPSFSAVGYYFGRHLNQKLGVPIGLIGAAMGGTRVEAWMPESAIDSAEQKLKHKVDPSSGTSDEEKRNVTSGLYNSMIHPLRNFPARGWIWYQGEANAAKAAEYRVLLPEMISSWRSAWDDSKMPFYLVQLAAFAGREDRPYPSPFWADFREVQESIADNTPHSGMVVTTDLGVKHDIHPPFKHPVGKRLANIALTNIYDAKDESCHFPKAQTVNFQPELAIVTMDDAGTGLEIRGSVLDGFEVQGQDKKWHRATAQLQGTEITLNSRDALAPITAVRYNWENYPTGNLFSKSGLPARPFRIGKSN